jgi:hypothetical protein
LGITGLPLHPDGAWGADGGVSAIVMLASFGPSTAGSTATVGRVFDKVCGIQAEELSMANVMHMNCRDLLINNP